MSHLPSATLETLLLRAKLLAKLRKFFTARGFLEVETPILSRDIVVDRHLDAMSTVLAHDVRRPDVGQRLWLQTSPEFGMKRLLAAGATAIFQVTRAFRNGEVGPLHNPEFTMVEWYRVGDDMAAGIALLAELCGILFDQSAVERLSYRDAFRRNVGVDPYTATIEEFAAAARRLNVSVPEGLGEDRDGWLNVLLAECVEPNLGQTNPTILYDYPATQAALAKVRTLEKVAAPDRATVRAERQPTEISARPMAVAERFELYVHGIELANGYHELLDADELRRRNATANRARVAEGKPAMPEDSRLLAAMEAGLPPCCGVALGFDRVAMLVAGAKSIAEVMAFPIDRA